MSGFRVAPGTLRLALVCGLVPVLLAPLFPPAVLLVPVAFGVAVWFNRDPSRTPTATDGYLSPADGRVSVVREEEHAGETRVRVAVFMNVTDVHVNRMPAPATVESVTHEPGKHLPAFTKESDRNERVRFDCGAFEVTLIAGAVARRIHPWVDGGAELERGQRFAHISFGSRADVLFPPEVSLADVVVERGEKVRAGESVLVA
ncbi:protein sorting system archaetidylserine decarboxylase [Salinirubellus salinus]|jgi:phosphatidylserine decarboxylase|uniref:Protein sorting system archaetidylserine decarboxylase n=1 Tax=Salinirubellus salinus TaxID=1364945 RepID=A0A9E7QZQ0_9EURY|nr:protein sorting system archaetidylserine decarboxylase [Salinirubellus salinus]UWM53015.1 protein sorting system archaetidylserine decarboxylase [Salinirubellus salinus]